MRTILYDLKQNSKSIGIVCVLAFVVIGFFWQRDLSSYSISMLNHYFFWGCYVGLVIVITNLHFTDFKCGTIQVLYVLPGGAMKVLFRRLLSALCVAVLFYSLAMINQIISIQKLTNINPDLVEGTYAIELLVIYVGTSAFLSAYTALVTFAVKSLKMAYFVAILPMLIINHFLPFIFYLGYSDVGGTFETVSKVLKTMPNGIITIWSETQAVSYEEVVLLLAWIVVIYVATWAIQKKRDYI